MPYVAAGRGQTQLQRAGLDDPMPLGERVRGQVGVEGEADLRRGARVERYAGVADQSYDGAGDPGDRVVQIELDDLGAGPGAGVAWMAISELPDSFHRGDQPAVIAATNLRGQNT
jgi:hypothetical protein